MCGCHLCTVSCRAAYAFSTKLALYMFNAALYEMEIGLTSCVPYLYNTQHSAFVHSDMSWDFGILFCACQRLWKPLECTHLSAILEDADGEEFAVVHINWETNKCFSSCWNGITWKLGKSLAFPTHGSGSENVTINFLKGLNILEVCKSGITMWRVLIICVLEIAAHSFLGIGPRVPKVPAF